MKKFFDGEFQKTSVWLTVPSGEMAARLFGRNAANIKALGTIFAGEADTHFRIEQFAPEVDLAATLQVS